MYLSLSNSLTHSHTLVSHLCGVYPTRAGTTQAENRSGFSAATMSPCRYFFCALAPWCAVVAVRLASGRKMPDSTASLQEYPPTPSLPSLPSPAKTVLCALPAKTAWCVSGTYRVPCALLLRVWRYGRCLRHRLNWHERYVLVPALAYATHEPRVPATHVSLVGNERFLQSCCSVVAAFSRFAIRPPRLCPPVFLFALQTKDLGPPSVGICTWQQYRMITLFCYIGKRDLVHRQKRPSTCLHLAVPHDYSLPWRTWRTS